MIKKFRSIFYILFVFYFIVSLKTFAQTVEITLPDTTATEGSTISIPILCNDVTGLGVYSYGFKIAYDQSIITATGVTVEEAISLPWGTPTFNINDGNIFVAAAGSSPLSGEGVLLFINFSITGTVGNNSILQFAEAMFNEGEPSVVTHDGNLDVVPPTTVKHDPLIPNSFKISQAYPNPFNPSTAIEFDLPQRSQVTAKVYDELGRFVTELVDKTIEMGHHTLTWDGYDQLHREVSSGIYFINISVGNVMTLLKVIKLK